MTGDRPRSKEEPPYSATGRSLRRSLIRLCSPERVQEALGELVGAAKEGLLALSVEVGLGVPRERLEQEVEEIVGPKGTHNPGRSAVRHGHEDGEVRRSARAFKRPRVHPADGESEVPLGTYEHFADRDQLAAWHLSDAGRSLDPQVPTLPGAGRRADQVR